MKIIQAFLNSKGSTLCCRGLTVEQLFFNVVGKQVFHQFLHKHLESSSNGPGLAESNQYDVIFPICDVISNLDYIGWIESIFRHLADEIL